MSDECLMKQETVFSFYTQYQAVMRKFTLAGKSLYIDSYCFLRKHPWEVGLFQDVNNKGGNGDEDTRGTHP